MLQKKNANPSFAKKLASTLQDGAWRTKARPEQLPPLGEWNGWVVRAGRGFGETRCGVEWVQECVQSGIASRIALVGPTAGDVRDVMVEGPAGVLSIAPPWMRPSRRAASPLGRLTSADDSA
jgi:phage terminase large subunit-like protein